jgi:hypothetical protein
MPIVAVAGNGLTKLAAAGLTAAVAIAARYEEREPLEGE